MPMQPMSNPYWSMTEGAFNCLIDKARTNALVTALKRIVSPGDFVVDAGTGTGILAMAAAAAGAKKVFAIERDQRNIDRLQRTSCLNGIENIEFIHGDACDFELPVKIDVFIVEMIATGLIEELQVIASAHLHKYAKRDSKYLIHNYTAYVDLVFNNNVYSDFKFDIFRYEYPDDEELKSISLSEKQKIFSIDFSEQNFLRTINKAFDFKIIRGGTVNGIRISGITRLGDGTFLGATSAYDYPLILPLEELNVNPGQHIGVSMKYELIAGLAELFYSIDSNLLRA